MSDSADTRGMRLRAGQLEADGYEDSANMLRTAAQTIDDLRAVGGDPTPTMRLAMYRQGIAASGGMTVDEIESRAHRTLAAERAPEVQR